MRVVSPSLQNSSEVLKATTERAGLAARKMFLLTGTSLHTFMRSQRKTPVRFHSGSGVIGVLGRLHG